MKTLLILSALVLLPVLACAQERVQSPKTVEWNGEASYFQVAIQAIGGEIILLDEEVNALEYYVDLQALGHYGLFAVLVRAVEFTEPDMLDYSGWARSDSDEDVILLDGVPVTFMIESRTPALKPIMIRIR